MVYQSGVKTIEWRFVAENLVGVLVGRLMEIVLIKVAIISPYITLTVSKMEMITGVIKVVGRSLNQPWRFVSWERY